VVPAHKHWLILGRACAERALGETSGQGALHLPMPLRSPCSGRDAALSEEETPHVRSLLAAWPLDDIHHLDRATGGARNSSERVRARGFA